MDEAWQWIDQNGLMLGWLGVLSLVMFFGSLIAIPILIARIPANYFVDEQRRPSRTRRFHPAVYAMLIVSKNVLGVILILGGIAMLVLPGQGLLTILIGISLSDFPGKYGLERRLVSQPGVFGAINWLRERAGKAPLVHPRFQGKRRVDQHRRSGSGL